MDSPIIKVEAFEASDDNPFNDVLQEEEVVLVKTECEDSVEKLHGEEILDPLITKSQNSTNEILDPGNSIPQFEDSSVNKPLRKSLRTRKSNSIPQFEDSSVDKPLRAKRLRTRQSASEDISEAEPIRAKRRQTQKPMPRQKLEEEEKKERKRLYERRRKARIKSDPALKEEHLRKDRERLARRKAAGLIPLRSQMSAHARLVAQKNNRLSARAYYYRKKAKATAAETAIAEPEIAKPPIIKKMKLLLSPEQIRPQSSQLLQRNVRSSSLNLRIETIVTNSSHCLRPSSPQDLSTASPLRTPSVSSINSEESILCPNSPNSDSSVTTLTIVKLNQDIRAKFRKYQKSISQQICNLTKQLAKANKEKMMYKKRYQRLLQEFKKIKHNLELRTMSKKPNSADRRPA